MPSYDKYRDTKFIQQTDVDPPLIVTINRVTEEDVSMENQPTKMKFVIYFNEDLKPWAPGFETLQVIHQINGSGDVNNWAGTELILYRDPNVSFGGKVVGGIRCRAPEKQPEPQRPPVSRRPPGQPVDEFDRAMESPDGPDYP